jgi:uncharacterized membrane protein YgcG
MRRPVWKLWALCGLAFGCSSQGSNTEIAVFVSSDLSVPAEIDSVQVEVNGKTEFSLPLPNGNGTRQVLQFELVPASQNLNFDVYVTGLLDSVPVVRQEVISSCPSGKRTELNLFLGRACKQQDCTSGKTTCSNGNCVSGTVANPEDLPTTFAPNNLPGPPEPGPMIDAAAVASDGAAGVDGNVDVADLRAADEVLADVGTDATLDVPIFIEAPGLDAPSDIGEDGGTSLDATGESSGTGGAGGMGGTGGVGNTGGAGGGGGASTTAPNCGQPPAAPTGGTVKSTGTGVGSTATYACPLGYSPASTSITCQADGTWSGTTPTCTIVSCPDLSNPTDGNVSLTGKTYQSTATYTCTTTGHTLTGTQKLTCLASGNWSDPPPSCPLVDCGKLTDPTHGSVTSTPSTTYGSTATYACSTGYAPSGGSPRQCQANGTWSGTAPTCEVNCGQPANPQHGGATVPAAGTWQGATVQYYCYGDLQLYPSTAGSTTCQANGTWSGAVPSCDCFGSPVAGWGTSCQYTCPSGPSVEGIKGCSGTCWQAATKC